MARILLVEDDDNIAVTMKICLKSRGHEIVLVQDGVAAVDEALEGQYDLVILDLLLPRMNGFLVMEALRGDPRTEPLPILVTSAKVSEEDIQRARRMGADEYLTKPFRPDELIKVVDGMLSLGTSEEDWT